MGRLLRPIPVLVIGAIWFSLADVQNALWAFQVSWYLTVFFMMVMLFALRVPDSHRAFWLSLAVLAALAASLTTVQGFFAWPLGAVCIVWGRLWGRQSLVEIAGWVVASIGTIVIYFTGYSSANNGCHPAASCSPSSSLHHPMTALGFFFALIGNVITGGGGSLYLVREHNLYRFEIVGVALFIAALYIVIQSWRQRAYQERLPLPLLLISFSLFFDISITLSRGIGGASNAIVGNRYVMPNIILLTGIVIYAWKHVPARLPGRGNNSWQLRLTWSALLLLAIFSVFQVTSATEFGLSNARASHAAATNMARLVDNLDQVPIQIRACELGYFVFFFPIPPPASFMRALHEVDTDQLGELEPDSNRYFHKLGPPPLFRGCAK
jgi:hypothetical protein